MTPTQEQRWIGETPGLTAGQRAAYLTQQHADLHAYYNKRLHAQGDAGFIDDGELRHFAHLLHSLGMRAAAWQRIAEHQADRLTALNAGAG